MGKIKNPALLDEKPEIIARLIREYRGCYVQEDAWSFICLLRAFNISGRAISYFLDYVIEVAEDGTIKNVSLVRGYDNDTDEVMLDPLVFLERSE